MKFDIKNFLSLISGFRFLVSLIIFDQITKYLMPRDFLVKNYGLPFGLDFGKLNFVLLFTAGILLLAYFFQLKKTGRQASIGLALIVAGAGSNIIDRIFLGYVRDFVNLGVVTINLADAYIVLGLFLANYKSSLNTRTKV